MGRSFVLGLIGGCALVAHASFDDSRAWPMIWPSVAAVLACWGAATPWRTAFSSAAGAFLATLLAGVVYLLALAPPEVREAVERWGTDLDGPGLAIAIIAGTALAGAWIAFLVGAAVGWITRRRRA